MIQRYHVKRNLHFENAKMKNKQSLYSRTILESIENKKRIFETYLIFSDENLLDKHGKEMKTSVSVVTYPT